MSWPPLRWVGEAMSRVIRLDAEAEHILGPLGEIVILIEPSPLTVPGSSLDPGSSGLLAHFVRIHDGRVELGPARAVDPHIWIRGSPVTVLRLLRGVPLGRLEGEGRLRVEGDRELLLRLLGALRALQPDWEEPLARLLGDVAGHQIAALGRRFATLGRRALASLAADAGEYLQFESRLLPSRPEWEELSARVLALTRAADDVGARLARLSRTGTAGGDGRPQR